MVLTPILLAMAFISDMYGYNQSISTCWPYCFIWLTCDRRFFFRSRLPQILNINLNFLLRFWTFGLFDWNWIICKSGIFWSRYFLFVLEKVLVNWYCPRWSGFCLVSRQNSKIFQWIKVWREIKHWLNEYFYH